jgi:hypothetical protein
MNRPITITAPVDFSCQARGRRRMDARSETRTVPCPAGRVPRVARLLALAFRFEQKVRSGVLASYVELAKLGHISRARISQIMNLVNLAPDIQEAILFLPRTEHGRDPIHLRLLQPIAAAFDWRKQRRLWAELVAVRVRGLGE